MSLTNTICAIIAAGFAVGVAFYAMAASVDFSYRLIAAALDRRRSGPPPP